MSNYRRSMYESISSELENIRAKIKNIDEEKIVLDVRREVLVEIEGKLSACLREYGDCGFDLYEDRRDGVL